MSEIEKLMRELNWQVPLSGVNLQWVPDDEELDEVREQASKLAEILKQG